MLLESPLTAPEVRQKIEQEPIEFVLSGAGLRA
ncbi:hypothetical protein SAMN05216256_10627 [Halopseudomonas pachastrellae]|nr:hypothetical protein SAMN05216256_10627 [Halopseudomonas pachastrellae]